MKYIKIKADTYNEAMMKLKMDHGDDAIPISHKYVKEGGFFKSKLFAKELVELTAAVQERKLKSSLIAKEKKVDFTVGDTEKERTDMSRGKLQEIIDKTVAASKKELNARPVNKACDVFNEDLSGYNINNTDQKKSIPVTEKISSITENERGVKNSENDSSVAQNRKLEKELDEIKKAIYRITTDRVNSFKSALSDEDISIKPFRDALKNNDFDDEECNNIINEVRNSISRDDLKDKYKIEKSLKDLLKSKIVTTGPIKTGNKKKIVMFIGPTGVGKTTTMAKLGAINSLREGHNVAFITIDTYRIAATEQLKKYAEIMSIPVYAVNNQKEFKDIIAANKSEIIMVDTSGRSHRNDLKISEIKSFADLVEYDFEKILCVSANIKRSDLDEVFRAFDTIHFNSIVITKVDETSFIGNVVNIADKYNKPISYFTNGQEVPNDIIVADPDKIVDMMIRNVNN